MLRAPIIAAAVLSCLAAPPVAALAQSPCDSIAWTTFATAAGPNNVVAGMTTYDGRLILRGVFNNVAGTPTGFMAAYDGGAWQNISTGFTLGPTPTSISGMAAAHGNLYVAGPITFTPAPFRRAAGQYFDGVSWRTIPMDGMYTAGATHFWTSGERLYAWGSNFVFANDADPPQPTFNRSLAVFTNNRWFALGQQFGPNSSNATLFSLVDVAADVYIAGAFTTLGGVQGGPAIPARNVARFTPAGGWAELGGGLNSTATIALYRNEIYACGLFTATGDGATPLNHFAKWNGSAWVQVAGGVSGFANMSVGDEGHGPSLFLQLEGAAFNTAPGYPPTITSNGLVRFDGVGFTAIPPINGAYNSIASADLGLSSAVFIGVNNRTVGSGGPGYLARLGPANSPDLDADGLLDHWETLGQGLDVDCDGDVDLPLGALGATPDHKDVFVEVDAMVGMLPDPSMLNDVIAAFAAAPVSNPDGQTGVRLHILVDETNLPRQTFPLEFIDFSRVKAAHFGAPADRMPPNERQKIDARRKVFRYCIIADHFSAGDSSSGLAELPGNDFMVTFGHPGWTGDVSRAHFTGTFMHELGHTLGLYHGGGQHAENEDHRYNYKPNYHSVMNYSWQFPERPGWTLDYSRQVLPPLDETALFENTPLGGHPVAVALIGPPPAFGVSETSIIDYDRNGMFDAAPVAADVNNVYPDHPEDLESPGDVLLGHNDWSALRYNFRTTDGYADGAAPRTTRSTEMTFEVFDYLRKLAVPDCPADFNADGIVNSQDFFDFLAAFFAEAPEADFNGDKIVNSQDFFDFLTAFFIGC